MSALFTRILRRFALVAQRREWTRTGVYGMHKKCKRMRCKPKYLRCDCYLFTLLCCVHISIIFQEEFTWLRQRRERWWGDEDGFSTINFFHQIRPIMEWAGTVTFLHFVCERELCVQLRWQTRELQINKTRALRLPKNCIINIHPHIKEHEKLLGFHTQKNRHDIEW